MLFPQRTQFGAIDEITVIKDEFLDETPMTFHLTYEEGSKIIVIPCTEKPNSPCDHRPNGYEKLSLGLPLLMTKGSMNICRKMQVEMFFHKREYVNLILVKDCNNFRSPMWD